jgi:hypothetical protein
LRRINVAILSKKAIEEARGYSDYNKDHGIVSIRNFIDTIDALAAELSDAKKRETQPATPGAREELAAQLHEVYEIELNRQGKVSCHPALYANLSEEIKDLDRALADFIFARDARRDADIRAEALREAASYAESVARDNYRPDDISEGIRALIPARPGNAKPART